jgi:phosphohistidine phosphatase
MAEADENEGDVMVRLYLVRHAIAFERDDSKWPDDDKRPLTHKGTARMRQIVDGLQEIDVDIDLVITSPLVRAKQTADLIIAGWPDAPALAVNDSLSPTGSPAGVAEVLSRHAKLKNIALVGHEPGLGHLAAFLIGARAPLSFKKGGIACIEMPTLPVVGPGQLLWHATPRMLRALSKR